jgi:hypothetical protein
LQKKKLFIILAQQLPGGTPEIYSHCHPIGKEKLNSMTLSLVEFFCVCEETQETPPHIFFLIEPLKQTLTTKKNLRQKKI